jgi:hypothetical protein
MKLGWIIAASSLLLAGQPVMAQTAPKIAGPYLMNYQVICQAKGNNNGSVTQNTGIAGFNAADGTLNITGLSDTGALINGTGMTQSAWQKSLTFTATATELTLTSGFGSQVYSLVFTPSGSTRAVSAFMFNGVLTATPNCTAQGTAIQQTTD